MSNTSFSADGATPRAKGQSDASALAPSCITTSNTSCRQREYAASSSHGPPHRRWPQLHPADTETSPLVAVINRALATQFFPNTNPVGKRFAHHHTTTKKPVYQIIGVSADAKRSSLRDDPPPLHFDLYRAGPESVHDLQHSHPAEARRHPPRPPRRHPEDRQRPSPPRHPHPAPNRSTPASRRSASSPPSAPASASSLSHSPASASTASWPTRSRSAPTRSASASPSEPTAARSAPWSSARPPASPSSESSSA